MDMKEERSAFTDDLLKSSLVMAQSGIIVGPQAQAYADIAQQQQKLSDHMRSTYRELTMQESDAIKIIKSTCNSLLGLFDTSIPDPRAKALAKTNLEQACMWAIKGITG